MKNKNKSACHAELVSASQNGEISKLPRSRNKFGMTILSLLFLAGCLGLTPVEPVSRQQYVSTLSAAVCYAHGKLNEAGQLTDAAAFEEGFERYVREYVLQQGIDQQAWLIAKEEYFTPAEHEKLLKMHFAWCITGLDEETKN